MIASLFIITLQFNTFITIYCIYTGNAFVTIWRIGEESVLLDSLSKSQIKMGSGSRKDTSGDDQLTPGMNKPLHYS